MFRFTVDSLVVWPKWLSSVSRGAGIVLGNSSAGRVGAMNSLIR